MPHAITIERHKLNQGMYQKLKKFIMNKRKREAEERAQDDYYKRLRKEREERKRQTKLFAESLENTRREFRPGHQAPVLSNTQPTTQVMGPLSYTDKQMLAVVFPPQTRPKNIPGQELKPASEGPGVMLNSPNSQAANEISQQDFKNFSKCLMGYANVGGKLPTGEHTYLAKFYLGGIQ
ncbi:unnamed protein product [Dibothriocephalus latus]|uniref:Uncharacterized protein n=1 Tax=Dibothriocephalus latus TaxID=60516 RepID=A0A3P6VEZ4_DIBLA|nr:unnamed protein product [Dibothriocephalus latus]